MKNRKLTLFALATAGVLSSGLVAAQTKTWNLADDAAPANCGTTSSGGANGIGNVWSCADSGVGSGPPYSLAVSAWSASNGTSTSGATGTNTFGAAAVKDNGASNGLGVGNASEGGLSATSTSPGYAHSMDNIGGSTDMLLLNFTSAQILDSVKIGWSGADGDYQVLRWNGTGNYAAIGGKSVGTLLTAGWELVNTVNGNGGISSPDIVTGVNSSNLSSSAWLISAYNSTWGGGGSSGADALKVLSVVATAFVPPTGVSAPGTLTLAAVGLFAAGFIRRRRA